MFNNESLVEMFNECNEIIFDGKLTNKLKIEWSNRMTASAGQFSSRVNRKTKVRTEMRIALSVQYHKINKEEVMDTLVHEMVHLKYPEDGHGAKFQSEIKRINKEFGMSLGQFATGKSVVNHIYKCVGCGNEYERARRIRKGSTCSCGIEGGKLEKIK